MVIITQARQLRLSPPPSTTVSAIFYDSFSQTLALMYSDSSFSLYPNTTPFSPPPLPPPSHTTVASPSSAAAFLRLGNSRVIFIVSSPYLAGTFTLLRFYILRSDNQFARVRVSCNQSELSYDEKKLGVLVKCNHGVGIKLAASINVFAMYSVSDRKVRVFAVRSLGNGDEIKLMKTAVIDCEYPVFSISVSVGFLILGEQNGVRVFPLRPLVKGRVKKVDKLKVRNIDLVNGMVSGSNGSSTLYSKSGKVSGGNSKFMNVNGELEEKTLKRFDNSAKLKCLKIKQNSREGGVRFVAFKSKEFEDEKSSKLPLTSIKAISIHFLAHDKFLILDSIGDLYLLLLSKPTSGSESMCEMKKLTLTMKVQNLAVLSDDSTRAQTVWVSDGLYTIHAIIVSDPRNENDTSDIEEKIQNSAAQVIFTSEKIQEIIPIAANAILLLGQVTSLLMQYLNDTIRFPQTGRRSFDHMLMTCFTYEITGLALLFKKWMPCVLLLPDCLIVISDISRASVVSYTYIYVYTSDNAKLLKRMLWTRMVDCCLSFIVDRASFSTVHATYASNHLPNTHKRHTWTSCFEPDLPELK